MKSILFSALCFFFAATLTAQVTDKPHEKVVVEEVEYQIQDIRDVNHVGPAVPDFDRNDTTIFSSVEAAPEFPGGDQKMMAYIAEKLVYPGLAMENGIEGRVIITFVVETDGSLTGISMLKGIDASLNAEALNVVKNMPKFNPGYNNGKPVRVQYNLPINFKLN